MRGLGVLLWLQLLIGALASSFTTIDDLDALLSQNNLTTNLNIPSKTAVKLSWQANADRFGVLKPTSMYMTSILALYDLCIQDWKGPQGPITYNFEKYSDVKIQIAPLRNIDGNLSARRWSSIVAIFRTMSTMDNILVYSGGVNTVTIDNELEVNVTFSTSDALGAPATENSLQEIKARSPVDNLRSSNYTVGFEMVDVANSTTSRLHNVDILKGMEKYYFDWPGTQIRPNHLFITIAQSMMRYGPCDVDMVADQIESDYPLQIMVKQYYGQQPPPEYADRQMTVRQALLGLRMIARTAVKLAKFQGLVMVMEREAGEPVGEFRISNVESGYKKFDQPVPETA